MMRLPVRRLEVDGEDARCHCEDRIDLDLNTTLDIQQDNSGIRQASMCRGIFA